MKRERSKKRNEWKEKGTKVKKRQRTWKDMKTEINEKGKWRNKQRDKVKKTERETKQK